MSEHSLSSFLKAARPEWTSNQLSAVEEKLEKVGVRDVLELVQSLKGRPDQRLNNRLKAVGEKCFTSETLSALRRRVREEPALRRAAEQRVANARLAAACEEQSGSSGTELLAQPGWDPAAGARSQMAQKQGAPQPPKPMPTSKDDMISALESLGLEVKKCHVRQMRAVLLEAERLRALPPKELLEEVALDGSDPDSLIRRHLETTFPDCLESHEASNVWTREHSPRSSADEDQDLSFQILTPSPEPLSLSTLISHSEDELIRQCKARGLWHGMESRGKGFYALLLKLDSRREYLQSLQAFG
ncbi:Hypothetical protein SCF082_LOCUS47657 [Durusdinium trenchii]|uniref:Uncharacterized protein n=2 Tax=Durusdinium trenchii TaxID=1381693 RepID=A0ABP0RR41_9DINO